MAIRSKPLYIFIKNKNLSVLIVLILIHLEKFCKIAKIIYNKQQHYTRQAKWTISSIEGLKEILPEPTTGFMIPSQLSESNSSATSS